MNISLSGLLELKADASHPDKPDSFGGAAGLWSVDMFYHHLQLLERLVPRTVSSYIIAGDSLTTQLSLYLE